MDFPRPNLSKIADTIHKKCDWRCWYCGVEIVRYKRGLKLHKDQRKAAIDHQTPIVQGGSDNFENLVSCCASCNSQKIGRNLEEFRMYMAYYSGHHIKEVKARFRLIDIARKLDEPFSGEILDIVRRLDATIPPYKFYGETKTKFGLMV